MSTKKIQILGTLGQSFDSGYIDDDGFMHLTKNEADIDGFTPFFIGSGGPGGDDEGYMMRLTNQNGTALLTTSYGSAATLMFTFMSTIDDVPTGNGICKISINGINKITMNVTQGLNSVDISSF